MRPAFLLVTITFLFCSCIDTGQDKAQLANTSENISLAKMILVSSGQMSPYTTIQIDGSNFDLVINDNDTTYLATRDRKFQTPEGYKVGTRFLELPSDLRNDLTKEPGWGYYYKLPSGWTLAFCEGNSCTDKYPENSSKVKWIFKRR